MSGSLLLDSNVIIMLSRGDLPLEKIFYPKKKYLISVITYMEVLGYDFEDFREIALIKQLLNNFSIIYVDQIIADQVVLLRKQNKKIKLPDAIILATAELHQADLVTCNVSDFKGLERHIRIINPLGNK